MMDLIERQAAVDEANAWLLECLGVTKQNRSCGLIRRLEDLPSAQPERKKGKWIIVDDCELFIAKCSECGRIEDSRMVYRYPYCHCGADMRGEQNDK